MNSGRDPRAEGGADRASRRPSGFRYLLARESGEPADPTASPTGTSATLSSPPVGSSSALCAIEPEMDEWEALNVATGLFVVEPVGDALSD